MDTEELIRDVTGRVRDLIAEAEEKAEQIVRDAEADAKQIRADADEQARKRLDDVRQALARLESTLESDSETEPEAEVESGGGEIPARTSSADAADRPTTDELIKRLKSSSD